MFRYGYTIESVVMGKGRHVYTHMKFTIMSAQCVLTSDAASVDLLLCLFHPCQEDVVEIQQFALEFSRIKDASALYRLLKTLQESGNEGQSKQNTPPMHNEPMTTSLQLLLLLLCLVVCYSLCRHVLTCKGMKTKFSSLILLYIHTRHEVYFSKFQVLACCIYTQA